MMRRSLFLALLAVGLAGCPPRESGQSRVQLPAETKIPRPAPRKPPPPREKNIAPIDTLVEAERAARITSLVSADVRATGVITALPHLKVFIKEKRIEIEGATAMKVGPQLELLACSTRGKAYESLLIWLCEPSDLQLALLMIGMAPTPQVEQFGEQTELTEGQKVVIEVEWEDPSTKRKVRRRAEDLLFDIYRDGCMKYAGWVFTGSHMVDVPQPPDWDTYKKQFAADFSGTIAVTYHDPDGVLDTPLAEGGNNSTYVAWEQRLPERHTPVVTHIRPWKAGDDKEPADALRPKNERRPTGGGSPGGGGGPMGGGGAGDDHDPEHKHDDEPGKDAPK